MNVRSSSFVDKSIRREKVGCNVDRFEESADIYLDIILTRFRSNEKFVEVSRSRGGHRGERPVEMSSKNFDLYLLQTIGGIL